MNLSNDELKHILTHLKRPEGSVVDFEIGEKIEEFLHYHEDGIDCPHCEGSGRVPEDFLTDEHVAEVFADYCDIFGFHVCYGVEKWSEGGWSGDVVNIVQDTSARNCYNSETHKLPKLWFTRDVAKRRELMTKARQEEKAEIARKKAQDNKDRIAELENELAELKGDKS